MPPRGKPSPLNASSSSGRKPAKSQSLPALGRLRSPLEAPQQLCTVHVGKKSVERSTVGGGSVKVLSQGRLPFSTLERGLEWERSHVIAKVPPQKLPPLHDVMRLAMKEFRLRMPAQGEPRSPASREKRLEATTYTPYHGGPRLPVRRQLSDTRPATSPIKVEVAAPPEDFALVTSESPHGQQDGPAGVKLTPRMPDAKPPDIDGASDAQSQKSQTQAPAKPTNDLLLDELPFPWKLDEVHSAFSRFDTDKDGELHQDELPFLLKYLGARPQSGDVEQIVKEQTRFTTLSYEEVIEFLKRFRKLDVYRMRDIFLAADKDGSGELDFQELFQLLHESGYYPTAQSNLEAFEYLDKDKNSTISFLEFEGLREYLRVTEGFTKADFAEIVMLYGKSALHRLGPDDIGPEAWRITMYLGYSATEETVREFCDAVNPDRSNGITKTEMLKVVRMVRELEIEDMKRIMAEYGDDPSQLPCEDLGLALTDLGYFVSEDAVNEILENLGECETEEYLTLEEFGAFLRAYRRIEGFTEEEVRELQEVFDREGRLEPGALHTLEVGKVLRWFGFAKTVQEVTQLVEEIDLDGSGVLEFGEFTKLMRRLTQQEAESRQRIFYALATKSAKGVLEVHISHMVDAVKMLAGATPDEKIVRSATESLIAELQPETEGEGNSPEKSILFVGRQSYEAWFRHFRRFLIQDMKDSAGYSIQEKAWLQRMFNEYDEDGGGTIERGELMQLVAAFFPDSMKSKEEQRNVQKALDEVDDSHKGELDFHKFLLLSRKCDDARDSRDMQLEVEVVKEYGYSHEEVDGFRQIFSGFVDWKGELDIPALTQILGRVVELSDADAENLRRLVREVHPQGREVARFPQFLRLVKRLTEENYGHLNDQADRLLKRQQQHQQMLQTTRRLVQGPVDD